MNGGSFENKISSAELERALRQIAREDVEVEISAADVLDYLEGRASQAQVERVHHALAHSSRLREELLEQLREIQDFDPQAVADAAARDAANPVVDLLPPRQTPPRTRERALRPPRWTWALAAAAVVFLLVGRPWTSRGPADPFEGISVLATARAFEPEVLRGTASIHPVTAVLPPDAVHVQFALWVPESWTPIPASDISATVSNPGEEEFEVRNARLDFQQGDPALLVLVDRSRLRPGVWTLRLRLRDAADRRGPHVLEAQFRLVNP